MSAIYYTLTALALYFTADFVLQRIEIAVGRRLEFRSLVFFFILSALALATFAVIRYLTN